MSLSAARAAASPATVHRDYSDDSDQEKPLTYHEIYDPQVVQKYERRKTNKLPRIIAAINIQLMDIMSRGAVVLPRGRPLFVVHFRGVHFSTQSLSPEDRREKISQIERGIQEPLYSSLVYRAAGLDFTAPLTPDNERRLNEVARLFKIVQSTLKDETLLEEYKQYVNTNQAYMAKSGFKPAFISASDRAYHPVKYALTGKGLADESKLMPSYNDKKRARFPKVGYVQIIFHTLQDYATADTLSVPIVWGTRRIEHLDEDARTGVVNYHGGFKARYQHETETTFLGSIGREQMVYTKVMRFPSYNRSYDPSYHTDKYGYTNAKYQNRKKDDFDLDDPTKLGKVVDEVSEHYATKLENKAQEIAQRLHGYIVYFGLNGKLQDHPLSIAEMEQPKHETINDDGELEMASDRDMGKTWNFGSHMSRKELFEDLDRLNIQEAPPPADRPDYLIDFYHHVDLFLSDRPVDERLHEGLCALLKTVGIRCSSQSLGISLNQYWPLRWEYNFAYRLSHLFDIPLYEMRVLGFLDAVIDRSVEIDGARNEDVNAPALAAARSPVDALVKPMVKLNIHRAAEAKANVDNGDQLVKAIRESILTANEVADILTSDPGLISRFDHSNTLSLLFWAIIYNCRELKNAIFAGLLISSRSDLREVCGGKGCAIRYSNLDRDDILLRNIVNLFPHTLNQQDDKQNTPLHLVLEMAHVREDGMLRAVKLLSMIPSLDLNQRNQGGESPLGMARRLASAYPARTDLAEINAILQRL